MSKSIEKLIKFEGENSIVWIHPIQSVDEFTTVICPHTHEVVFIKEGVMLESLKPGSHQLIEKEDKKFFSRKGLKEYFCNYIFVNVTSTLKVLWGTPTRIDLFDPKINIPVSVGLNGSLIIKIENARKFISKIGGLDKKFTVDGLQDFFRGIMLMYIKESLAKAMIVEKISFYEIWSNMRKISTSIKRDLESKFLEYGVELCEFTIENILISDDIKQMVENMYKQKFELDTKGLTFEQVYQDQKAKEIAERELAKETIKKQDQEKEIECEHCGQKLEVGSKYCSNCGKNLEQEVYVCKECNYEILNKVNFCPNCGVKLMEEEIDCEDIQQEKTCCS